MALAIADTKKIAMGNRYRTNQNQCLRRCNAVSCVMHSCDGAIMGQKHQHHRYNCRCVRIISAQGRRHWTLAVGRWNSSFTSTAQAILLYINMICHIVKKAKQKASRKYPKPSTPVHGDASVPITTGGRGDRGVSRATKREYCKNIMIKNTNNNNICMSIQTNNHNRIQNNQSNSNSIQKETKCNSNSKGNKQ